MDTMEAMFAALSRQGIAVPDALGAMGAAGIVPSAAQLEEAFYAGMHGSPRLQLLPGQKRPRTDLMNLMSLPPNTAPVENSVPMTCQNEAFRPAPAFAQPQAYGTNMFADTQTHHANCDADRLKNLRLSNIRTSVSNEMVRFKIRTVRTLATRILYRVFHRFSLSLCPFQGFRKERTTTG